MFNKNRQDILEDAFVRHEASFIKYMEKEEQSFAKVINTLDLIKDELHNTNKQMSVHYSDTKLKILEVKDEIYKTVFDRLVSKREYEILSLDLKKEIRELELSLKEVDNDKVSRREVKYMWSLIVTCVASFAWIFERN